MTRVCLTFDFDAVSIWVSTFKQTSASPLSRGEYGARVGLPRILELLARQQVKATFFVPAHTAVSFPDAVRRIQAEGHEIASHGFCHESPVALAAAEEAALLQASIAKLQGVLGSSFRPVGYRSPAWDLSANSIAILEDQGFRYDSSLMADDFRPYHPRRGDQVDPEKFTPGVETSLVELPVAWELDDYPYFHWSSKPFNPGLHGTAAVLEVWRQEFNFCHQHVGDGIFTLTNHPEIIGRGPRILMLERLIEHMRDAGAVLCTAAEATAEWRDHA